MSPDDQAAGAPKRAVRLIYSQLIAIAPPMGRARVRVAWSSLSDSPLGQDHVLNADTAGLHRVVGELALDVLLGLGRGVAAPLGELDRSHSCSLSRKECRLSGNNVSCRRINYSED